MQFILDQGKHTFSLLTACLKSQIINCTGYLNKTNFQADYFFPRTFPFREGYKEKDGLVFEFCQVYFG